MICLITQGLAAQTDDRRFRDLLLRCAGGHAVDRDLAAADIRLGLAPGSGAGIGQIFVQTDHARPSFADIWLYYNISGGKFE